MASREREVTRTRSFERSLERLVRKHPELEETVEAALRGYASNGPGRNSDKIPGLSGQPVFKQRLRLSGQGQRGAARIVYYCDSDRVLALFVYVKSGRDNVSPGEIRDALESAGLLESVGSPPDAGTRQQQG